MAENLVDDLILGGKKLWTWTVEHTCTQWAVKCDFDRWEIVRQNCACTVFFLHYFSFSTVIIMDSVFFSLAVEMREKEKRNADENKTIWSNQALQRNMQRRAETFELSPRTHINTLHSSDSLQSADLNWPPVINPLWRKISSSLVKWCNNRNFVVFHFSNLNWNISLKENEQQWKSRWRVSSRVIFGEY